ncbi:AAA family ATPase [Larkinella knui]|uniref:ATP-binding protein n=1 Tax=Larkinella knui TaxID=2025310 RepID=A0A3P1CKG3_9BACT|nr:ATP-binding protein [Larkinella knui]RRB13822.1 ATP-binding protein [Larkinella knui]
MVLYSYESNDQQLNFVDQQRIIDGKNIFTVIVGKNGTGKSSLLNRIVREFLGTSEKQVYFDTELGLKTNLWRGRIRSDNFPNHIIAVSTSPFDKFPISRRFSEVSQYTYLGLRDLMSSNFGLAYMSKIFASLVQSVLDKEYQAFAISRVLDYLGYNENIHASLSLFQSRRILEELVKSESPLDTILSNRVGINRPFNRRFIIRDDGEIDFEKLERLIFIAKTIHENALKNDFNLTISSAGIELDRDYNLHKEDILFLLYSGILKLKDIDLESKNNGRIFSIRDASSGEQSVILSILGIASKIQENSLICIDEPEICLHPEWQEKYIQMLINTFSSFNNCHFIIATHSPQIISKLEPDNCFISSIETEELLLAADYIKHSVDFQLANIFNSPGYKNEYLSRIALNIFTKVSRNKKFDTDDNQKFKLLKRQASNMDINDPLIDLVNTIIEMHNLYA